jgi:hypothetical protein
MTRKHFTAIAAELRRQRPTLSGSGDGRDVLGFPLYSSSPAWDRGAYDEWATIVIGLADVLAAFNPGFKRERFLTAAGLEA